MTRDQVFSAIAVGLALCAGAPSFTLRAQATVTPAARPRMVVVGQTDSAGLALSHALISRLSRESGAAFRVLSAHDIDFTVAQAYRAATDPLSLADIKEFGKLLHGDLLVALTSRRIASVVDVTASVAAPSGSPMRKLGNWPLARAGQTAATIARALEADSVYRRLRRF